MTAVDIASCSSGYDGPLYPAALSHMGQPAPLPWSGGWCLQRTVVGSELPEILGPYPWFTCSRWDRLANDVEDLAGKALSIVLVTDPFAATSEDRLVASFSDVCRRYKEHYVVDLQPSGSPEPSSHHRRQLARARRDTEIEIGLTGAAWEDDWVRLYELLVRRHSITGPAAFSRDSFTRQLRIPGMLAIRALHGGETVGMQLWALAGDGLTAHYHLGACSPAGYEVRAAYALMGGMLDWLARAGVRQAGLGAGAGTDTSSSGLDRFKRGWATRTRPVYLCGRVLDRAAYRAACRQVSESGSGSGFFPAYRSA
jgi:hypothetical protein